jgi:ankyrin repeat protein
MLKEEKSLEENETKREEEKPIVLMLLENNIDVNLKNNDGFTAVTLACIKQNWNLADELIFNEHSPCNINLTPDYGTPLHIATKLKHVKTIRSLILQKCNAKLKDKGKK